MSINAVLSDIQRKLQVPKTQYNSFAKFHYRSCEDILEAVKKLLPEGVTLTITDDILMIGDRFYIRATAHLSNGEQGISTHALAREVLEKKGADAAQITGGTSSYARKYALAGLFLIDDSKDADSRDNKDEPVKRELNLCDRLMSLVVSENLPAETIEKMKEWMGVKDFREASEEKLKAALTRLGAK